jgi:glycine/D-amino acid oxidase-like deaminating enzyme
MAGRAEILVTGGGVFGLTAALELIARGYGVRVLDPGPLPHPLAASTDISKVVRLEYGPDEDYTTLAERARKGWLEWNAEFGEPLYHEVGLAMLTQTPMSPGGFEYESYQRLTGRGYSLQRLDPAEIDRRFPAWNSDVYVDGYFSPYGGYAESGRVIEKLVGLARASGVRISTGDRVAQLVEDRGRVTGVLMEGGQRLDGDHLLVAAGTWTQTLVPELESVMHSAGQPVFHLKPADPKQFSPPGFPVFSADVSSTGWYGFPVHPIEGVVKIARHGVGRRLDPQSSERVVSQEDEIHLREFLRTSIPTLAEAPVLKTRLCLYSDTPDEHFWIAQHPSRPGLTVAGGGSGHAFKFAPVLGSIIADAIEGHPNPILKKFAWRSLPQDTTGEEATRYRPNHSQGFSS